MIGKYVSDLAERMKIPLTDVSIVNVNPMAGSTDVCILRLSSGEHTTSTLIFQLDLEELLSGANAEAFRKRIALVLERLRG